MLKPSQISVIVKPLSDDASNGIDTHSIVETEAVLMDRARFVWNEFRQPALAEEFIEGRRVNVAVWPFRRIAS